MNISRFNLINRRVLGLFFSFATQQILLNLCLPTILNLLSLITWGDWRVSGGHGVFVKSQRSKSCMFRASGDSKLPLRVGANKCIHCLCLVCAGARQTPMTLLKYKAGKIVDGWMDGWMLCLILTMKRTFVQLLTCLNTQHLEPAAVWKSWKSRRWPSVRGWISVDDIFPAWAN